VNEFFNLNIRLSVLIGCTVQWTLCQLLLLLLLLLLSFINVVMTADAANQLMIF